MVSPSFSSLAKAAVTRHFPFAASEVAYVCRWHVPNDESAPEMTPELKVFKDADALDRWRIADLDPAYLRTSSARQLLDASYALWEATHGFVHAMEMFERIIDVARTQGLVVDA